MLRCFESEQNTGLTCYVCWGNASIIWVDLFYFVVISIQCWCDCANLGYCQARFLEIWWFGLPELIYHLVQPLDLLPLLFRWFKFTLKPPYRITLDKLWLTIWDTSFWTFWLKFGTQGTLRRILGPILVIFEICQFLEIPGLFKYFSENGWSQKIKVFLMKERSLPPYRFGFRSRGP